MSFWTFGTSIPGILRSRIRQAPASLRSTLRNSAPEENIRTFLPFARSNDESASHTVGSSSTIYTISFGDPMNDLLRPGGQAFLTARGAGHLLAANRSLKVHGHDKGYMLRTTRTIRLSQGGVLHEYGVSRSV